MLKYATILPRVLVFEVMQDKASSSVYRGLTGYQLHFEEY